MHANDLAKDIENYFPKLARLKEEINKVLVGQNNLVEKLLIGLLADGHIIVEGVPGLAKTTAIKALSDAIEAHFSRIQFTPDLLPADLVGTEIYSPKDGNFTIKHGPIHANLVLADEINRAPAKVQSALLEAMQEKQVTIGEKTFKLPTPFLVMATQNPIEQEGTYPLPEAQVDRFMMKVLVSYPSIEEEIRVMKRMATAGGMQKISPVITLKDIEAGKELVEAVFMDDKLFAYIADLVFATRQPAAYKLPELTKLIEHGASPRASIHLVRGAKVYAMLQGRSYVTPQDIKSIAIDVMRHRLQVSYEAEAQDLRSDDILQKILDRVDVP